MVEMCEKCGVNPVRAKNDPRGKRPTTCDICYLSNWERDKANSRKRRAKWTERQWWEHRARYKARSAQDRGELEVKPCSLCRGWTKLEKHHHDYSQPLNVTWLCQPCHLAIDQLEGIKPATRERLVALHAWCPPRDFTQEVLFA